MVTRHVVTVPAFGVADEGEGLIAKTPGEGEKMGFTVCGG